MKRGVYLSIGLFVALVVSISFSSAYIGYGSFRFAVENIIQAWIDILEPILQAVLGGDTWTGYLLFEKLLIFVLLLSVIQLVLGRIPTFDKQKGVRWVVAVVVSLIGVRYLDFEWINTIVLQYQVLAVAITAFLPFVIYFFFLHSVLGEYGSVRKIGWILFIMVYFGLWNTADSSAHSDIYFWTMLVALLFLLFDGTIRRYWVTQRYKAAGASSVLHRIAQLDQSISVISQSHLDAASKQREIDKLEKEKKYWYKELSRLS
ncbi:hypothetical protein KW805_01480 [Candidatus Pacearchaeota archaeon]|nr:hypothetical protein [Candidatus Pacearchaeota archaeon]